MENFRVLDPIKVSLTGLSYFLQTYKVKENASLVERLERLELLSKDKNTPENDRKSMKSILEDLNKIMTCDLCHKEIN